MCEIDMGNLADPNLSVRFKMLLFMACGTKQNFYAFSQSTMSELL